MNKVCIIGGGASGMIAAIVASKSGADVTLIEKNEKLGKKIYITGKGRCNLTNDCDRDTFFENVVSNPKFMYSAFATFDNKDMLEMLSQAGLKMKTERGGRVFPESDHASDVTGALKRLLDRQKVKIKLNKEVTEIITGELFPEEQNNLPQAPVTDTTETTKKQLKDKSPTSSVFGIKLADGSIEEYDRIIVCTGGLTYPSTGSTGFGLSEAKRLGLKVTETRPSLVPFEAEESYVKDLQGLAPRNVAVKVTDIKGKTVYKGFGEMLFTHFGVSGPLMLSASAHAYKALKKGPLKLTIDFKPAVEREVLDKRIVRIFDENKNKSIKNAITGLMPASMIPVVLDIAGIDHDKHVNEVSKAERAALLDTLKSFPVTLTGLRGYNEAIITAGGLATSEVNPGTMEAKKIKGLYFAGEVLDVDALTGGFNLQIAWSTGYLAGLNASE